MTTDGTPPESAQAWRGHCGRGPCWREDGHDGPCEPGNARDPRRRPDDRIARALADPETYFKEARERALREVSAEMAAERRSTIRRVARPRGELSEVMLRRLSIAKNDVKDVEQHYRAVVLLALEEGSFAEVSKATGLSTNTLQRWKREAAS